MAPPTPTEILHERLKAFLLFLKPVLLGGSIDQDRLAQLRRLSDVRIRKYAIDKPQITGIDLCGLLADPRIGRFDDAADGAGLLRKGHFEAVLPILGEDMSYLIEACLTLQVAGMAAMKGHAKAFVDKHGPAAAPAGTAAAGPPKTAAVPLPAPIARLLAPIKDLWTLPPSTLKALSLLAAADSPADAVCAEIERDPALAAAVLRVVNSSPAAKASSIKKAVVTLGYPLVRRTVLTAALVSKLASPPGFDSRAHWLRALEIGHAAALVSKAARLGNPDEHFFAGLLHSIGRLAEAKAGGPVPDASPVQAGAAILERWRFPAPVVEAARHHADTAERLEELQIPREAVVVAALRSLVETTPSPEEARTWAGFLRIAADSIPQVLAPARASAEAAVEGWGA